MQLKVIDFQLVSVPVDFQLSWGKMGFSRHVFITIEDSSGNKGMGEGVLYKTTHLQLLPYLEQGIALDPDKLLSFEPGLAFAVDTAIRDIKGELVQVNTKYPVVREIFLEDRDLKKSVDKILSSKTKAIKLKVGAGITKDKETISRINEYTKGQVKINLDANRGYDLDFAVELAVWGRKNNVVLFEEPIHGSFSEIYEFKKRSGMKVMLDESVQSLKDLDAAIKSDCFDILNVKLTRLGGITKAEVFVRKCENAGIQIYLGCSEEQEIGTNAIFTLAKSVKNLYAIEGFGFERIDMSKGFAYSPVLNSRELFLIKEFYGIWKTRAENILIRLCQN